MQKLLIIAGAALLLAAPAAAQNRPAPQQAGPAGQSVQPQTPDGAARRSEIVASSTEGSPTTARRGAAIECAPAGAQGVIAASSEGNDVGVRDRRGIIASTTDGNDVGLQPVQQGVVASSTEGSPTC